MGSREEFRNARKLRNLVIYVVLYCGGAIYLVSQGVLLGVIWKASYFLAGFCVLGMVFNTFSNEPNTKRNVVYFVCVVLLGSTSVYLQSFS